MVLFDCLKMILLNFLEFIIISGFDDLYSYILENYLFLVFVFGSEVLGVFFFNLIDFVFF